MKKMFRSVCGVALFAAAALAPTAAMAQSSGIGYYFFNDGNGTCGYVACGQGGCAVVDTFPCPREMSED